MKRRQHKLIVDTLQIKGTDLLSHSIPKWMALFPSLFPACSMLKCVTVFLSLPTIELSLQYDGTEKNESLAVICIEHAYQ